MVFVDSVLVVIVLLSSFSLSLHHLYFPKEDLFQIVFIAPFLAIPIFFSFRMYHSVTRFIGARALWSIAQAVTLYAVVWGLFSLMSNHPILMQLLMINSDPFSNTGDERRSISFNAFIDENIYNIYQTKN